MTKSDRPTLGLDIEYQIETAQNQTHTSFWPQLEQLQAPTPQTDAAVRREWPMIQFQPPLPKRPHALRRVLGNYASLLFESEVAFYPKCPGTAALGEQTGRTNRGQRVGDRGANRGTWFQAGSDSKASRANAGRNAPSDGCQPRRTHKGPTCYRYNGPGESFHCEYLHYRTRRKRDET